MNRCVRAAAVVLALLTPAVAAAQTAGVTRSVLPNGLTVLVRENAAAPVVAYSLLVKMGTRTETPANAGISNMLQIMLVRGTESMNGEQIAAAADRMGGSIDAYGDQDYGEIAAAGLSRNWRPLLELVADVALRPSIPEGTVGPVRDFVLRQIRNRGDKPFDVASDRMREGLFGTGYPYSWDPVGRRESVERFTRESLVAHYRRHYVGGEMVLAVSGDVKAADVLPQVQRLFAALPAGKAPAPTIPALPPLSAKREVFAVPGAQAQIFMAALAPPFTHPDFAPLKVMTAILGGGMASRFFSDLRDQQALAYSTGAHYQARLETAGLVAALGTAPANVEKAEAALKGHLVRIQNEPASAEEVAVARSYVVGSQAMDRRTNARQAWYLAAAELAGVGYEYFDIYEANVRKVTAADVQRVARKYLGVLRTVIVQPQ
jgi:predicted Zn-dependent peptidase